MGKALSLVISSNEVAKTKRTAPVEIGSSLARVTEDQTPGLVMLRLDCRRREGPLMQVLERLLVPLQVETDHQVVIQTGVPVAAAAISGY